MRRLLKCTVRTAVEVGLLDLAVQAVDGTKVAANAAGDQTCDMARLEKLLASTEDAISELEAQNKSGNEPSPPCLPAELRKAQVLRERIQNAMSHLAQDDSITFPMGVEKSNCSFRETKLHPAFSSFSRYSRVMRTFLANRSNLWTIRTSYF